jgi:hypothetical protein
MRKPSLTEALTPKPAPVATVQSAPPTKAPRLTDQRINTTLRIEPELLEELKIIAARRRVRVNDLLLDGVRHVLALHRQQSAA